MNAAGMIVLVQKMVIPRSTPSFLLRPLTNQTSETLWKGVLFTIIDYHPNTKTLYLSKDSM